MKRFNPYSIFMCALCLFVFACTDKNNTDESSPQEEVEQKVEEGGDEKQTLAATDEPVMAPIEVDKKIDVRKGLRSNNPFERESALRDILTGKGADIPSEQLRMPLYDSDTSVRIMAINVLIHKKITAHNEDILVLLTEGEATVRAAAAKALSVLGDKAKNTIHLWRSLSDVNELVRHEAVISIDKLHGTKLGFYYNQNPDRYRAKAQKDLKEFLKIPEGEVDSHAAKIYGKN